MWWSPSAQWFTRFPWTQADSGGGTVTLWDLMPVFETYNQIALADPTAANRAAVDSVARHAEKYFNPAIKPGGRIKLDNNDIKEEMRTLFEQAAGAKKPGVHKDKKARSPVRRDPDGIYKVLVVSHTGDTRGQKWETELLCKALAKGDQ